MEYGALSTDEHSMRIMCKMLKLSANYIYRLLQLVSSALSLPNCLASRCKRCRSAEKVVQCFVLDKLAAFHMLCCDNCLLIDIA